MITKFNIFEKHWTEEEIQPVKLIEKLINIFKKLGFEERYVNQNNYDVTYFDLNNETIFYIKGGLGRNKIAFNSLGEDFTLFKKLRNYFRTIDGLNIEDYFFYFDIIIEDFDKVMSQITFEDMELKMNSEKYNI